MMRLALWLQGRSARERWLLALMGVLALPAALWLAVAEPLLQRRAEARAALAEAADLRN
jgi:type II secretory pathway component PulM